MTLADITTATDTSMMRLSLRLSSERLVVMIFNPLEDNSLIIESFPLPSDGSDPLPAIENLVYEHPVILNDFAATDILVESNRFLTLPDAIDPDSRRRLFDAAHPDIDKPYDLVEDPVDSLGIVILTAIPSAVSNFLRRTFNNIPLSNSCASLLRYCHATLAKGNTVKAFVNIRPDSLDIMVLSHSKLWLLNRFEYSDINDAAYYILAATDPQALTDIEEILLMGDRDIRSQLLQLLRRFRPYVVPLVFPSSMYRAGDVAMTAPFDMIILPLTTT